MNDTEELIGKIHSPRLWLPDKLEVVDYKMALFVIALGLAI